MYAGCFASDRMMCTRLASVLALSLMLIGSPSVGETDEVESLECADAAAAALQQRYELARDLRADIVRNPRAYNAGMGEWAPHEGDLAGSGRPDVGNIAAAPAHETVVLLTRQAGADALVGLCHALADARSQAAASRPGRIAASASWRWPARRQNSGRR